MSKHPLSFISGLEEPMPEPLSKKLKTTLDSPDYLDASKVVSEQSSEKLVLPDKEKEDNVSASLQNKETPLRKGSPATIQTGSSLYAAVLRVKSNRRDLKHEKKMRSKRKNIGSKSESGGKGESDSDSDALGEVNERRPLTEDERNIARLRRKRYHTLSMRLKQDLNELKTAIKSKDEHNESFWKSLFDSSHLTLRALEAKYNSIYETKPRKPRVIPEDHPLTAKEMNKFLRGDEELERPWIGSVNTKLPSSGLLFRVTDESSMAKLDPHAGFLSYGSEGKFNTKEQRQFELESHGNWGKKGKTSLISTSGNPENFRSIWIKALLNRDLGKPSRNTVKVTFINALAMLADGLPIISMLHEILHYKVQTPPKSFFEHEFACLYRILPKYIVGTWCWTEIKKWQRDNGERDDDSGFKSFVENVAMPALQEHENARKEGRPVTKKAGCSCYGN